LRRAEIVGIRAWKRWQVAPFLKDRYDALHFARTSHAALRTQLREGGDLVVWAAREPADFATAATLQGARVVRIEDGFLRSVGLGSDHVGGASLVIDPVGIYFDPRRPSALETFLQSGEVDAPLLARARRLREAIVQARLSKYNVGRRGQIALGGDGRRRVLVPGQVEDDASVRFGSPRVRTNLELLRAVREAEPDAWIVYKPHPDTEAGNRAGAVRDRTALAFANQVVRNVDAAALLRQVDAIHTMTSLMGFEALLRGVPVTAHGQPFYAGWGLTMDRMALPRRTRRRSLDELVAATLIVYPSYVHPETQRRCEPEDVVAWLASRGSAASRERGTLRRALQLCQGLYRSYRGHRSGALAHG
jgi:capsular polysaccharide export protein